MTPEDVLRHELAQACGTIEFLHGCLTDPVYKYAYPQQSLDHLKTIRALAAGGPECSAGLSSRHTGPCPVHSDEFQSLREQMMLEGERRLAASN